MLHDHYEQLATLERPTEDDDLDHVTCCHDDDLALCGTDVSAHPWNQDAPTSCVVCAELDVIADCSSICPLTARQEAA